MLRAKLVIFRRSAPLFPRQLHPPPPTSRDGRGGRDATDGSDPCSGIRSTLAHSTLQNIGQRAENLRRESPRAPQRKCFSSAEKMFFLRRRFYSPSEVFFQGRHDGTQRARRQRVAEAAQQKWPSRRGRRSAGIVQKMQQKRLPRKKSTYRPTAATKRTQRPARMRDLCSRRRCPAPPGPAPTASAGGARRAPEDERKEPCFYKRKIWLVSFMYS